MSVAAFRPRPLPGHCLLVEHCLALGFTPSRPSARARLEATLGRDLTQHLVFALSRPRDDDEL
jgi:hypothetical protein